MTSECREVVSDFKLIETRHPKFWLGFIIFEAPGIVDGHYFDGKKKIELKGMCKIEPQRQVSILGHNSLKLDFLLPPEGIGFSFDLDSHLFKKKVFGSIQLMPRLSIKIDFDRINA